MLKGPTIAVALAGAMLWTGHTQAQPVRREATRAKAPALRYQTVAGRVTMTFDPQSLEQLGWSFVARGDIKDASRSDRVVWTLGTTSSIQAHVVGGALMDIMGGELKTRGAMRIDNAGDPVVIGNLIIGVERDGRWTVRNTLTPRTMGSIVFELPTVLVDFVPGSGVFRLSGELALGDSWARKLGRPDAGGLVIGSLTVEAKTAQVDSSVEDSGTTEDGDETGQMSVGPRASGPDVIVGDIPGTMKFPGSSTIAAFSIATTSCNIGDTQLDWFSSTPKHPVIGQNMFRLKDGAFEQIGQSWLKHGFFALSDTLCSGPGGCAGDPSGTHLGVGCSDTYGAGLNGTQSTLGPRSEVNPFTGVFPYPFTAQAPATTIDRRLQVHHDDLDPALNSGALYFVEGHYVTPDDAQTGNGANNASYRRINVSGSGGSFNISITGTTQREQAAIRAWQDNDPAVVETDVRVPGEGLFLLAATATDLGDGTWHYEYAIQNLDSDRACGSVRVPAAPNSIVTSVGFHAVDSHSGEPYDLAPWTASFDAAGIIWSTVDFDTNPDANALRWGTLYNFRFDSDAPPAAITATLGLFKPGDPLFVVADTIGPEVGPSDCNSNGINDPCDVDCGAAGGECDLLGCGQSFDCGGNGIPDECEENAANACDDGNVCTEDLCEAGQCIYLDNDSVPCDVGNPCTTEDTCAGGICVGGPLPPCLGNDCTDCNNNGGRDDCEGLPDCDGNGIPDECEFEDCNGNNIADVCDIATGTEDDCDGGPVGVAADAGDIFGSICMACHGPDGSGGVGPDIRDHSRIQIWNQLLAPTTHSGGTHPEFTEQDFANIEAFLATAGSRGRPDRVPDACQLLPDCDNNLISDGCELEHETMLDLDNDGMPDECVRINPPTADLTPKNRYISFTPAQTTVAGVGNVRQAFRLTAPDDFPDLVKWVGQPDENNIARLECSPVYRDWSPELVHVGDRDIVPGAVTYVIQSVNETADVTASFLYSDPPTMIDTVAVWADVAGSIDAESGEWTGPNGFLNVNDVIAVLHRFGHRTNAPPLVWVDLDGDRPNTFINVSDIQLILLAINNKPYPFGGPVPCE